MKHYLQLIDANSVEWQDFNQFYVISVNTERQILVHFVRSRNSQERGIRLSHVLLDEAALLSSDQDADLNRLDEELKALAAFGQRRAKMVELRFFGGSSLEGTGAALGVSPDTVWRDWDLAKARLYREKRHGET